MVQISHDAFARTTLDRELVATSAGCSWCDQRRKSGKLFEYYTQSDGFGSRPNPHKGLFCSKSCHDAYHD